MPLRPRKVMERRAPGRTADDVHPERGRALPSVATLVGATVSLRDLTPADLRPA